MSTYLDAISASFDSWMSVIVGILNVLPIFFKIERDFKSPIPVKLSISLRLAFLKLPLKTNGILSFSDIEHILLAIS